MNDYKSIRPFRAFCQMHLPSAYDESLTYYEQICHILALLKEVVNNVDYLKEKEENDIAETNEKIDALRTDMIQRITALATKDEEIMSVLGGKIAEIEGLINSLRDELPEKIEEKLDEMAESGTLAEMLSLSHYLFSPLNYFEGDINEIREFSVTTALPRDCENMPNGLNGWDPCQIITIPNVVGDNTLISQYIFADRSLHIDTFVRYFNKRANLWTEWVSNRIGQNIIRVDEIHGYTDANAYPEIACVKSLMPYGSQNLPNEVIERNNWCVLVNIPSYFDSTREVLYAMQFLYEYDEINAVSPRIFVRNYKTGLFGEWKEVSTGGGGGEGGLEPPSTWNVGCVLETSSTTGKTTASTKMRDVFIARNTVSSNMNENNQNGVYYIREISSFLNIPTGMSGTWELIVLGDEHLERQILVKDDERWERRKSGSDGSWESWKRYRLIRSNASGGEIFNSSTYANEDSHAEGSNTACWGKYSHSEGLNCGANGEGSHAEGNTCYTNGYYSHVEGSFNQANGYASHSEGEYCNANGQCSHAEGFHTKADGDYSHASGFYTEASNNYQTACGKYNKKDTMGEYAFIVGNGSTEDTRSNAFGVMWDGTIVGKGINNLVKIYEGSMEVSGDRAVVNLQNFDFTKYRAFAIGICSKTANHTGFCSLNITKISSQGISVANGYTTTFYEDTAGNIIEQLVHVAVGESQIAIRMPVKGIEIGTSIYGRNIENLTSADVILYGIE